MVNIHNTLLCVPSQLRVSGVAAVSGRVTGQYKDTADTGQTRRSQPLPPYLVLSQLSASQIRFKPGKLERFANVHK